MIGELAGLGAAIGWAAGSIFIKPLSIKFKALPLNCLRVTVGWVWLLIFLLPLGKIEFPSFSSSFLYIIGSGIIAVVIGYTLYIKSLRFSELSKIYPISSGSFILFITIVATFLGEKITFLTVIGAISIILGIVFLTVRSLKIRVKRSELRGFVLALLAGFCWAAGACFVKIGVTEIEPLMVNVIRLPFVIFLLAIIAWKEGSITELKKYSRKELAWGGIAGLFDQSIAAVLFFFSIQLAGVAKATILSNTSPLFVLPFSIFFLKEKVSKGIIIGTFLCVVGIWLCLS